MCFRFECISAVRDQDDAQFGVQITVRLSTLQVLEHPLPAVPGISQLSSGGMVGWMDFVCTTDHNSSGLPKVLLLLSLERIKPCSFSFFSNSRKSSDLLYINSFQGQADMHIVSPRPSVVKCLIVS